MTRWLLNDQPLTPDRAASSGHFFKQPVNGGFRALIGRPVRDGACLIRTGYRTLREETNPVLSMCIGEGIRRGMARGSDETLRHAISDHPFAILFLPVTVVGGGIAGGIAAHPAKEIDTATVSIEHVYSDRPLLGSITKTIAERIQRLGIPVQLSRDNSLTLSQPDNQLAEFNSTVKECESTNAKNCLLLLVNYGFYTKGEYSPDLRFVIHVKGVSTNAVRSHSSEEFSWVYESSEFEYFDATKDNGEILRNKVAMAQERLCDRIIDDLFLVRSSTQIMGKYFPLSPVENVEFRLPSDTASRVPTEVNPINSLGRDWHAAPVGSTR